MEIFAVELVAFNTCFYWERILFTGCQYVSKPSQDFRYKTDFFELIFFQSHQKTWQNYWRTDLSTVLEALTSWLYTSVLTRGFLGFYITSHFAFYNLRNKSLLRLIFSWKYSKFYLDFGNGEKKLENYLLFGDNRIWIGCFKHALLLRENTWHRVLIC